MRDGALEQTELTGQRRDLPGFIWLGLPLACVALRLVPPLLGEYWCRRIMFGEADLKNMTAGNWAIQENLTVLLLLPAVALGILIFRRRRELPKWIGILMLLGGLAALYFAAEECSYGQDYIGFPTPEWIKARNDQDQFNLHRLETSHSLLNNLFENIPRQILLAATIVGGMVLPLVLLRWQRRPEAGKSPWYWLVPNYRLVPIAAMAVLMRLPDKLDHYFTPPAKGSYLNLAFFETAGEFKELCFALVMLLYLWSVYLRIGPRKVMIDV